MAIIDKYPAGTLASTDYLIGVDRSNENVTRNIPVSEISAVILAAKGVSTVSSIKTESSPFVNLELTKGGLPISALTTTGIITPVISATGTPSRSTYLRGDGTWSTPGPVPEELPIRKEGFDITTVGGGALTLDFTDGGVVASNFLDAVTVKIEGPNAVANNIIPGGGISTSGPTSAVTITNAGVTEIRAGGNITLSATSGDNVKISSTANPGTVTGFSSGPGLTEPAAGKLAVSYSGNDNIIESIGSNAHIGLNDEISYNQTTSSAVKNMMPRDFTEEMLVKVKEDIDNGDEHKVVNNTDTYDTTAVAKYAVTLTQSQYNTIPTKDPNTLYIIIGETAEFTVTAEYDVSGLIVNGGPCDSSYSFDPPLPQSITGPTGTPYDFLTTLIFAPGTSYSGMGPAFGTSGSIGSADSTATIAITGTITCPVIPSIRALLDINLQGNITDGLNTVWEYDTSHALPGAYDPASGYSATLPYNYSFGPLVKIKDTNTYKWSVNPTYDGGAWGAAWASGSISTTAPSTTIPVTHNINATWNYVEYPANIVVDTSRITLDTTGSCQGSGIAPADSYSLSPMIVATPTRLAGQGDNVIARYNETVTWGVQTLTASSPDYTITSALTYEDASGAALTPADLKVIATLTTGNTVTVYAKALLCNDPAAKPLEYRMLDAYTAASTGVTFSSGFNPVSIANLTITPNAPCSFAPACTTGQQKINGAIGESYSYAPISVVNDAGTYWDQASNTYTITPGATLSGTFGTTPAASGTGTQGDPKVETLSITGPLSRSSARLTVISSLGQVVDGGDVENITYEVYIKGLNSDGSYLDGTGAGSGQMSITQTTPGATSPNSPLQFGSAGAVEWIITRTSPAQTEAAFDGYFKFSVSDDGVSYTEVKNIPFLATQDIHNLDGTGGWPTYTFTGLVRTFAASKYMKLEISEI